MTCTGPPGLHGIVLGRWTGHEKCLTPTASGDVTLDAVCAMETSVGALTASAACEGAVWSQRPLCQLNDSLPVPPQELRELPTQCSNCTKIASWATCLTSPFGDSVPWQPKGAERSPASVQVAARFYPDHCVTWARPPLSLDISLLPSRASLQGSASRSVLGPLPSPSAHTHLTSPPCPGSKFHPSRMTLPVSPALNSPEVLTLYMRLPVQRLPPASRPMAMAGRHLTVHRSSLTPDLPPVNLRPTQASPSQVFSLFSHSVYVPSANPVGFSLQNVSGIRPLCSTCTMTTWADPLCLGHRHSLFRGPPDSAFLLRPVLNTEAETTL